MKSHILFFLLCVSVIACKTSKNTPTDIGETPVLDITSVDSNVVVFRDDSSAMEDAAPPPVAATMSINIIEYYIVKTENGKSKLVRQEKSGQSVLRTENEQNFMDVVLDSGEKFTCKQQKHPETNIDVYVKIGGTTPENEH